MDILIEYVKTNKWSVLMGIMVLLSIFANFGNNGQYTYFAVMLIMAAISVKNNEGITPIFVLLPIWLFVSSFFNNVVDYRLLIFALILCSATPLFSSYKNFVFRGKVFYAICMLLPIVTLLNLYAYQTGINYVLLLNYNISDLNFSGFTPHPMWLSAINGASNIVLTYLLMQAKYMDSAKKNLYMLVLATLLILSLYLSIVAASRSALAASLLAMAAVVFLSSDTSGKFVRYAIVIMVIASFVMPFLKSGSTQMQKKMDNESTEGTSRDAIWDLRIEEFKESPIFGVGFATARDLITGEMVTGTVETGSGWLSILSESGLIGAFIIFIMLKKSYVSISEVKDEGGVMILFLAEFIYLCLHSVFEGYIFTPGYAPCMFFWLLIGFFYEYNKYKYEYDYVQGEIEDAFDEDDDEDEFEEDCD